MRPFLIVLLCVIWMGLSAKTFVREYTYKAGESDSKISSRAIALEQVKRLLLEEVGIYIQSSIRNEESEANGQVSSLTEKDIKVLSAGITQTKVLDEMWNGVSFWLKAEITLDEKDVLKQLDDLMNNEKYKKALEDNRLITDNALAELERLRLELEQEKDKNAQAQLQKDYITESEKLSAAEWNEKGSEAYFNSDYPLAITYLKKSVEIDPSNANVWFTLALANKINKDFGQSIICLNTMLELDSLSTDALVALGEVYQESGDIEKAMQYYNKTLEINPNNMLAYINLSMAYEKLEDFDNAIASYKRMLEFDDEPSYEVGRLGEIYYNLKDYPNSIIYYRMAAEIDTTYYWLWMSLGDACYNNAEYLPAVEAYKKALALQPDDTGILNSIGKAYYDLGDYGNCNKYYIQSAKLGDTEIQAWCDANGIKWQD